MKYIINTKGEVIFQAEDAGYFKDGLCAVQVNGKWGYINKTGNVVIPCVYERAYSFRYEGTAGVKQEGKYGLINKCGKILVPCIESDYNHVPLPHEGIICIYIENLKKTKCIDVNGNHLFTKAGIVGDFSEGIATIYSYKNGTRRCSAINKKGEYIIPEGIYCNISDFHDGVAHVISETTGKCGFINHKGEVVVPLKYDSLLYNRSDPSPVAVAVANIGDKYGYVDIRNGKELYPIILDKKSINIRCLDYCTDNMFVFSVGENIYIYNLDNCKLFKLSKYNEIYHYSDGLCCVRDKLSEKIGFINKEGNLVIPCIFEGSSCGYIFHGNTCAMSNIMIDRQGNILRKIPKHYQSRYRHYHFYNGYYIEEPDSRTENLLDNNGNIIYSCFRINGDNEFPIAVRRDSDGKWGFIDKLGKLVIPYQFNDSYYFQDGFATLEEPITKVLHNSNQGCYIATAMYGSYDCPEVWTLRRYRDKVLDHTWYGRLFIRIYYSISPTLVRWFGTTHWFRELFYKPLNNWVAKLNKKGFKNTPYRDKY